MTPRVVLQPKRARPFYGRHPWVFAGAVGRLALDAQDGPGVDPGMTAVEGAGLAGLEDDARGGHGWARSTPSM